MVNSTNKCFLHLIECCICVCVDVSSFVPHSTLWLLESLVAIPADAQALSYFCFFAESKFWIKHNTIVLSRTGSLGYNITLKLEWFIYSWNDLYTQKEIIKWLKITRKIYWQWRFARYFVKKLIIAWLYYYQLSREEWVECWYSCIYCRSVVGRSIRSAAAHKSFTAYAIFGGVWEWLHCVA